MNRFQFSMSQLHRIIIAEAHNGKTVDELTSYLQSRGWTQQAARHFVHNSLHADQAAEPMILEKSKPRLPLWMPVLFWLSALSGLLWVLVDMASRLNS
jgi:hypothetical protein